MTKYKNTEEPSKAINYAMPESINLYQMINPNLTTTKRGVVYFNSSMDYEDNAYPQQLVDLYNEGSATHSALVNLKRDLLIGNGLQSDDTNTVEFLNKVNTHGDNLQKVWNKICTDYAIFESFATQIIYRKDGGLYELLHQDMSKVRAMDEEDLSTNIVKTWLISNQWAKISNKQYKRFTTDNTAVSIANFNPSQWSIDGRQLAVCKQYSPNSEVYAIPSYQSVLQYVMLDRELNNYHLNKVSGGLFANAIVYLTGNPNDEEKKKFINDFKRKYVGANKEKLLFVWGDFTDTQMPKVIPFSTEDSKDVFAELNEIITQKIITAHRATPDLAGIATKGSDLGGDANKLAVSRAYYIKSVIEPMRKEMLDTINSILSNFGMGEVYVENEELNLIGNGNNNNTNSTANANTANTNNNNNNVTNGI
jgi:hypothetical protein